MISNIIKLLALAELSDVSYYKLTSCNKGVEDALTNDEKAKIKEVLTNELNKIKKSLK